MENLVQNNIKDRQQGKHYRVIATIIICVLLAIPVSILIAWFTINKLTTNTPLQLDNTIVISNENTPSYCSIKQNTIMLDKEKIGNHDYTDVQLKLQKDTTLPKEWKILLGDTSFIELSSSGKLSISKSLSNGSIELFVQCTVKDGSYYREFNSKIIVSMMGGYIDIVNSGIFAFKNNDPQTKVISGLSSEFYTKATNTFTFQHYLKSVGFENCNRLNFNGYSFESTPYMFSKSARNANKYISSQLLFGSIVDLNLTNVNFLYGQNADYDNDGLNSNVVTTGRNMFAEIEFDNLVNLMWDETTYFSPKNLDQDIIINGAAIDPALKMFRDCKFSMLQELSFENVNFASKDMIIKASEKKSSLLIGVAMFRNVQFINLKSIKFSNVNATVEDMQNCSIDAGNVLSSRVEVFTVMFEKAIFDELIDIDFSNTNFIKTNSSKIYSQQRVLMNTFLDAKFYKLQKLDFKNAIFMDKNVRKLGTTIRDQDDILTSTFKNTHFYALKEINFGNATLIGEQEFPAIKTLICDSLFLNANLPLLKKVDFGTAKFINDVKESDISKNLQNIYHILDNAFASTKMNFLNSVTGFKTAKFVAETWASEIDIFFNIFASAEAKSLEVLDLSEITLASKYMYSGIIGEVDHFTALFNYESQFSSLKSFSMKNAILACEDMVYDYAALPNTFYIAHNIFGGDGTNNVVLRALETIDISNTIFATKQMINNTKDITNSMCDMQIAYRMLYSLDVYNANYINLSNSKFVDDDYLFKSNVDIPMNKTVYILNSVFEKFCSPNAIKNIYMGDEPDDISNSINLANIKFISEKISFHHNKFNILKRVFDYATVNIKLIKYFSSTNEPIISQIYIKPNAEIWLFPNFFNDVVTNKEIPPKIEFINFNIDFKLPSFVNSSYLYLFHKLIANVNNYFDITFDQCTIIGSNWQSVLSFNHTFYNIKITNLKFINNILTCSNMSMLRTVIFDRLVENSKLENATITIDNNTTSVENMIVNNSADGHITNNYMQISTETFYGSEISNDGEFIAPSDLFIKNNPYDATTSTIKTFIINDSPFVDLQWTTLKKLDISNTMPKVLNNVYWVKGEGMFKDNKFDVLEEINFGSLEPQPTTYAFDGTAPTQFSNQNPFIFDNAFEGCYNSTNTWATNKLRIKIDANVKSLWQTDDSTAIINSWFGANNWEII